MALQQRPQRMSHMDSQPPAPDSSTSPRLPRNVKLLGWASLLNDVASEMIFPLLPQFLIRVLGGSKAWLGVIEGAADSVSSLVKLWSGGRSDRGGGRKRFVVFGYALAALVRPLIGLIWLPWQLFGVRDRRSDRQGHSHLAARRADRRLDAAGDPRPGVRLPPRHGPSRRGRRAAAGRRLSLVLARCARGRVRELGCGVCSC